MAAVYDRRYRFYVYGFTAEPLKVPALNSSVTSAACVFIITPAALPAPIQVVPALVWPGFSSNLQVSNVPPRTVIVSRPMYLMVSVWLRDDVIGFAIPVKVVVLKTV